MANQQHNNGPWVEIIRHYWDELHAVPAVELISGQPRREILSLLSDWSLDQRIPQEVRAAARGDFGNGRSKRADWAFGRRADTTR